MPVRELTKEEIMDIRPESVSGKQGVSNFERFTLKHMANDPEIAKQWLRGSRGYHVTQWGGGFNFATQPAFDSQGNPLDADPDKWDPTDPAGFDLNDFLIDLLPAVVMGAVTESARTGIGAIGAATGAGLTANPVGAGAGALIGQALGAGAAGMAEDVALQGVGMAIGVNKTIDPMQTLLVGGLSAALPMGIAGARTITKGARDAASARLASISKRMKLPQHMKTAKAELKEFLAEFAGFPELHALPAGQQLSRRADTLPFTLPSLSHAAGIARRLVGKVNSRRWPEETQLIDTLTTYGKGVDITDEIDNLIAISPNSVKETSRSAFELAKNNILSLAGAQKRSVMAPMGPISVGGRSGISFGKPQAIQFVPSSKTGARIIVSGEDALDIKRLFQNIGADAGLFDAKFLPKLGKTREKSAVDAFHSIREKMRGSLPVEQQAVFDLMNDRMERGIRAITRIEKGIARGTLNENQIRLGAQRETVNPEAFFKSMFDEPAQAREALKDFDELFDAQITEYFDQAIKNTPVEQLQAAGLIRPNGRMMQIAEDSRIGSSFGQDTLPGIRPPFTTVGQFRGTAVGGSLGGAIGGSLGALGGPAAALTGLGAGTFLGGVAGTAMASPRLLTAAAAKFQSGGAGKLARAAMNKLTQNAISTSPLIPASARTLAFALLQQMGKRIETFSGDSVVREDPKPMSAKEKELRR